MLTAPTEHNKYIIQGLPRHTTFKEVVEAMRSPGNELGLWNCKPLHYIKTQDRNTTDMMVIATSMPGGQADSYAAMGMHWLRIGKHVKAPRPNAWSKALDKITVEQPPSSEPRKPARSLWSDAEDEDFGMAEFDEPTDEDWGGFTCAGGMA